MTDLSLLFLLSCGGVICGVTPFLTHISANLRAGKEATSGPFTEMNNRLFSLETFILFLLPVRIWFMAFYPLSHLSVDTVAVGKMIRRLCRCSLNTMTLEFVEFLEEYGTVKDQKIVICM